MAESLSAAAPTGFATTECRYVVTASDLVPASYDTANLLRISDDYGTEFVATEIEVDDTSLEINDYTFHFAPRDELDETEHTYQLDLYLGTTLVTSVESSAVTPHTSRTSDSAYSGVTSPDTWIKNPTAATGGAYPVTVMSFDGYQRSTNIVAEHRILGSNYPFIITDGVSGLSGTFSLLVADGPSWASGDSTIDSIETIDDLFGLGEILYFQTTWPALSGIPDFHFLVRDYTVTRLNRVVPLHLGTNASLPSYQVDVNFVEQERPADQGNIAPLSWQTIKDNYASWTATSAANASWLNVLVDG